MTIETALFQVAATPANFRRFGKVTSGPNASLNPQMRVAALTEVGSHAVVGATIKSCRIAERTSAATLADRLHAGMLVFAGPKLFSYAAFTGLSATGADLAWQIGRTPRISLLHRLPDGSRLALLQPRGVAAERHAQLALQAEADWQLPVEQARLVRVLTYSTTTHGRRVSVRLLTTVLDPSQMPASDLIDAHQRWTRTTSALDTVRTCLCGEEVLRSQLPALVEQQMWGLLLAHHAIRALATAAPAGSPTPHRSFDGGPGVFPGADGSRFAALLHSVHSSKLSVTCARQRELGRVPTTTYSC
ncbi:hypothetical protein [Dactylosporangium sp. NPDC000521]|uniref:hypothetical protein n=1 Tax=Dactylosporangium sp. NPDC000521 TaxID=3363975 RepID=UPI0036A5B630